MDKAVDAFRTISEVADDLDVPKHVLRFWEVKFPQIKPMKRGGGRRYYRPEDLELLRGIRHLLHAEGYTIKGVQKILREHGVDQVKSSWRERAADRPRASAPAGARPGPSTVSRRQRVRPISDDQRRSIEQVLAELAVCRALLVGKPEGAVASRRPRRAQAAS